MKKVDEYEKHFIIFLCNMCSIYGWMDSLYAAYLQERERERHFWFSITHSVSESIVLYFKEVVSIYKDLICYICIENIHDVPLESI
jgi:hypothetical protein